MSTQADVVKKASLKVKVVRSKTGPASAGLQGVRGNACLSYGGCVNARYACTAISRGEVAVVPCSVYECV